MGVYRVFLHYIDISLFFYYPIKVRSVIALHNLINNKITNRDAEKENEKAASPKRDESKETKDAKGDGKDAKEAKKDDNAQKTKEETDKKK